MRGKHRLLPACAAAFLAWLLAQPAPSGWADELPLNVGGGHGSEIGNYPSTLAGQYLNSVGQPCRLYHWDRPLGPNQVLRVRSASCPGGTRPGTMMATELDRQVIPMADSRLRFLAPEPGGASPLIQLGQGLHPPSPNR
jgi:hypothetical protein